jgi:hypothetical protein
MHEKKAVVYKSPDLTKLQAVIIDLRTIIYIALDANPDVAREQYLQRNGMRKLS